MVRADLPRSLLDETVIQLAADEPTWDAYVLAHPDATGHHCWRWRNVIEKVFGHRTDTCRLTGLVQLWVCCR